MGTSAQRLLDWMQTAGLLYWQVLPLGPTGFGDSPYAAFSAFAGNPYLIDMAPLMEAGLLERAELNSLAQLPAERVDFARLYQCKWPLLRLAWRRFRENRRAYLPNYGLFEEFKESHSDWLESYCGFMALKENFGGRFWGDWPEDCRSLESAKSTLLWQETSTAREGHAFIQYLFFGQWNRLKKYANTLGIQIIGDLPIFVALDSADVWANPGLFLLESPGKPSVVAGVPPDYFSKTGQLWGNPLFDWKAMKSNQYTWWMDRLRCQFTLCDVLRLDHFRGFQNYWEIPADAMDARGGKWVDGPGSDFFNTVRGKFSNARIIAEDLGEIDDGVRALRDEFALPGMAILQFAFSCDGANLYLPHNLQKNSVCYPGTHDNNTSLGWYEEADEDIQDQFRRYFRVSGKDAAWDFIRAAYATVSNLAIIPMQDFLSLDSDYRMNEPGTGQGNWQWRMTEDHFHQIEGSSPYLRELAWLYNR